MAEEKQIAPETWESYKLKPGARVNLGDFAPDVTEYSDDKKAARAQLKRYRKEIDELAAQLAAEEKRSLLVILQGLDGSGKDGAVRRVFTGVNPQYCKVVSFKEPDHEELAHDYLWRIYRALPARGEIGVFNRSHYEDAIVMYARGKLSKRESQARLRQIVDVERIWAENGIVIRKFFLHISRHEQKLRFEARLDTPDKHWKVQQSDFADRKLWPKFQAAYEEALAGTATPHAPWYIIPANHKWYRDVAIAGIVLHTLRTMKPKVPMPRLDPADYKL